MSLNHLARRVCESPALASVWFEFLLADALESVPARGRLSVALTRVLVLTPSDTERFWSRVVKIFIKQWTVARAAEALSAYFLERRNFSYAAAITLATAAFESGDTPTARAWFAKALCFEPGRYEATHNLGLVTESGVVTSRFGRRRLLEWAVRLAAGNERIYADWLQERYREGDASAVRELLELGAVTGDIAALCTASMVAVEVQQSHLAKRFMTRGVVLSPGDSMAYSKRAVTSIALGDVAAAETDLHRSMSVNPLALEPMINHGRVMELKGGLRQALDTYKEALAHRPDLPEPRLNAAILLLGFGDFSIGWDWYEARWKANAIVTAGRDKLSAQLVTSKPTFDRRRCDRVLVWAEQGLGDELMFASMFPDLMTDAGSVVAQIDVRLMSLFKRSFPSIEFHKRIRSIDEGLYDSQISMGSLGRIYRRSLNSFAVATHPYLKADPALSAEFRSRVATDRTVIGISWSTVNPDNGRHRSLDLRRLCNALVGKSIQLISLQYKHDLTEMKAVEDELGVSLTIFPDVDNFAQIDRLASVICACDMVISIGNATAHLAAALGRPTWVLTPAVGSWRWMFEGIETPWYPSVRVFRQRHQGNWDDVLRDLSGELDNALKLQ